MPPPCWFAARSGREEEPPKCVVALPRVIVGRPPRGRLTVGLRRGRWHRRGPLTLQPRDCLELAEVEEDPSAAVALLDVDPVSVVRAHRPVTLRTLHARFLSSPWASRKRYRHALARLDERPLGVI